LSTAAHINRAAKSLGAFAEKPPAMGLNIADDLTDVLKGFVGA
jgi:hypothetical protein